MTKLRLLERNLLYHWRGNFAVFLGVVVGAAVLTGALLVGDSLSGSLHDRVLQRLGWVDQSLVTNRFLREQVAAALTADRKSPAIILQGSVSTGPNDSASGSGQKFARRLGGITILGVDESWDEALHRKRDKVLSEPQAVLSAAVARELEAAPGDTIVLHLPKASAVPRESLLGRTEVEQTLMEVNLPVASVLSENDFGSRFSLSGSPDPPRNVYVPLRFLQEQLGQQGRINAVLVGGGVNLEQGLRQSLNLEDWGLVLRDPESRTRDLFAQFDREKSASIPLSRLKDRFAESFLEEADENHDGNLTPDEVFRYYCRHRNYISLESRQTLLSQAVEEAALAAAKEAGLDAAPTFVYLADTIAADGQEVPYSIVAALDPKMPPPLGPFLPPGVKELHDDEIILAEWQQPWRVQPGDEVTLSYYVSEEQGKLALRKASFRLRGTVPLEGVAADPDLTPEFPGVTDQLDIREWKNPPFPFDRSRVKDADELYWKRFRTTPKAYITLAKGKELWGSRFGQLTSIRLAPRNSPRGWVGWKPAQHLTDAALPKKYPAAQLVVSTGPPPTKLLWCADYFWANPTDDFSRSLLAHLRPEQGGFVFDSVLERGLQGNAGSSDFSGLFLGFSIFLIAAALLLVGLLFRLNLDRRAGEIGLLLAAGYRRRTIRGILLAEGGLVSAAGALVGLGCGFLYAWLLLELLRAWWPGGLDRSFLHLHGSVLSCVLGYAASVAVSLLTILWAVRLLGRVSPRALLAGQTTDENIAARNRRSQPRWSLVVAALRPPGHLPSLSPADSFTTTKCRP